MLFRTLSLAIGLSLLSFNLPANSQSCIPIPVVGGQGNEVKKAVAQPTIPGPFGINVTRNNWNTDWAIPGGQRFKQYLVTISSEKGGKFNIKMYLKYSDKTADEFYNQKEIEIKPGETLKIQAFPRPNNEPYQVNVFVGGINNIGGTYTASVVGCR